MIRLEVTAPKLPDLQRQVKSIPAKLTAGQREYLETLLGSGAVSIEQTLKEKLLSLLYNSSEPDYYQRTMSLLEATRAEIRGNEVHLYIDDEWLKNRPHVQQSNMRTGYAYNARAGSDTPYSMRVEEDFGYKHRPGGVASAEFVINRQGTGYMEETFKEVKEDIFSGDKEPIDILKPILKGWS